MRYFYLFKISILIILSGLLLILIALAVQCDVQVGFSGYPFVNLIEDEKYWGGAIGMGGREGSQEYWLNFDLFPSYTEKFSSNDRLCSGIKEIRYYDLTISILYHKDVIGGKNLTEGAAFFAEIGGGFNTEWRNKSEVIDWGMWSSHKHVCVKRKSEIHSSFCEVDGQSFSVTPDGYATACFEVTDGSKEGSDLFLYGKYKPKKDRFVFDKKKLKALRSLNLETKEFCKNCFCRWNCAGDCPAKCPQLHENGIKGHAIGSGARCEINRAITQFLLEEKLDSVKKKMTTRS